MGVHLYSFIMGLFSSNVVKAQKVANKGNIELAKLNNAYDKEMWEATNQWNLDQWYRENEYNSASSQVQRLLEAGINPLWAMSDGNPGMASQLTSAAQPTAHDVTLRPEYDPDRISNIVTAARDVVNAGLGFSRLGVESYDAETRRAAQRSQENLNLATAGQKRAATTATEVETKWNLATFDARASAEQQKLQNMKKQLDLMDAHTEAYKALKANYDASTDLAREKYNRIAEDYELAWKRIAIDQYNAESNRIGAQASASQASSYAEQVGINRNMAQATVAKWNNDQLLEFLKSFGTNLKGEVSGKVKFGALGNGAEVAGKAGAEHRVPANIEMMEAAGLRAIHWAAQEPDNPQAVEAARIATQNLDSYQNTIHSDQFNPSGIPLDRRPSPTEFSDSSVLNPPGVDTFGSWSSWQ